MLTIRRSHRQAAILSALSLAIAAPAFADWQQDDKTLSWKAPAPTAAPAADAKPVWTFSFDPTKGKTFFEPLTVAGGPELTNYKPEDHPWHYGLWFSWKYINHVNYWEEDRNTGAAVGKTAWKPPTIVTKLDGSSTMHLDVTYTSDKGQLDMTETREIAVSVVAADGSYKIDWKAHFTAGKEGADLDRTPLLGEPQGAVNGGYAGIGLRMAGKPLMMNVMTTGGAVETYSSNRARPNAPAVGCNFIDASNKDVGSIAIFSDPANTGGKDATWYIINDNTQNNVGFRFACPSILAPKIIHIDAGKTMDLHYQFAMAPKAWTADALKAEQEAWMKVTKAAAK